MSKASLFRMNDEEARALLEAACWPDGPVCPKCGSKNVGSCNGKSCRAGLKQCRGCRKQFTVTVGTIFESSHIGLGDWMYVIASMCASKKGISALQIKHELRVSYETAWFMCHRVREAMNGSSGLLNGVLLADETYVGGKPRKNSGSGPNKRGRGTKKTPVVAVASKSGEVRTKVVADVTAKTIRQVLLDAVDPLTSMLVTDDFKSYQALGIRFICGHFVVRHGAGEYVSPDGNTTNEIEAFFSLLKRGVYGSYHSISKKHLQRYCHEFEFRWNNREMEVEAKTLKTLRQVSGKRLTYAEIIASV